MSNLSSYQNFYVMIIVNSNIKDDNNNLKK